MSQYYNDSIFWIEVDKIKPNPFQPRKEFNQDELQGLSDSIRQYGVLQALVVTRKEVPKDDGGLATEYELVAGERRLRAAKLAGIREVPVLIRTGEDSDLMKLELAIIENIQREDLNPVDRARAFQQLVDKFNFKHSQIAEKVGKSREYVTNSMRLLSLPPDIVEAISSGKIFEGHARPLMMLNDRPEEQSTLFKEILYKKLTVREAEAIARRVAYDRVRKKDRAYDPELVELEERLQESLGTRVHIERKENGGKLSIDFFSNDDLRTILDLIGNGKAKSPNELLEKHINSQDGGEGKNEVEKVLEDQKENLLSATPLEEVPSSPEEVDASESSVEDQGAPNQPEESVEQVVQQSTEDPEISDDNLEQQEATEEKEEKPQDKSKEDDDLYSVRNFSL